MSVPDWVSYVGLGGALVGTGLGLMNYRRISNLKMLDLRLELRRKDKDFVGTVESLRGQMDYAKRSRERVAAASGVLNSGVTKLWRDDWDMDNQKLGELEKQMPSTTEDYASTSPKGLESLLVERHELISKADRLCKKYSGSIAEDDKRRDEIRAAMISAGIRDKHLLNP